MGDSTSALFVIFSLLTLWIMNNNYFSLEYYFFANVEEIIVFVKSIIIFVGSIGKSDTSLWDLIYNVGAGCR